MNRIKLLATLFVGIFIGYTVATFSFSNKQNESGLVQEQQLNYSNINEKQPDIAYVNAPSSSKNISSPLADKVIDPSSRVTQVSTSSHQKLEAEYQQLDKAYLQSKRKISSLQRKLDEFDESNISTKQMEALVIEPFKNSIGNFVGAERNEIYNFHQEEEDLDWGYNMQNNISDFISTHYNANEVNLVSVICKQQRCELLIIQHVDEAWRKIAQDLGYQDWWKFRSSNSTSHNHPDSDSALAIYTFLAL